MSYSKQQHLLKVRRTLIERRDYLDDRIREIQNKIAALLLRRGK